MLTKRVFVYPALNLAYLDVRFRAFIVSQSPVTVHYTYIEFATISRNKIGQNCLKKTLNV